MRTFPGLKLSDFPPEVRPQVKIIDDMLRQVSGGLARSIQTGQSPAANPVPSLSNPTGPPPQSGTPQAAAGDLLVGLANGSWSKLPIGSNDAQLIVSGGFPFWLATVNQLGYTVEWRANGSYIVDTVVDGGVIAPTDFTISAVWLYRLTPGSAGSTTIDLNKNGTTMYTTQANRPSIAFDDADSKIQATLPDITSVVAGDILSIDIDVVESGSPGNLVLVIKGV
jgi:hypothetical protein